MSTLYIVLAIWSKLKKARMSEPQRANTPYFPPNQKWHKFARQLSLKMVKKEVTKRE